MGVIKTTELAAVTASRKFGEPPTFTRQFVVEVDDPATSQTDVSNAPGIVYLDEHPEASYSKAFNVSVSNYNSSRWHYLVEWTYELPKQSNLDPNPLARPDIWRWSTSGMAVPALYYYAGTGNADRRTLTNTAGDFFEGAMTDISVLEANITGNRATFDYGMATLVTNTVNATPYLGGAAYTWKCEGISGTPQVEVVNEQEFRFWQVEAKLTFRPDGHPLILPNVGWNYVAYYERKRVYVLDENGEKIPASNPQPLDETGNIIAGNPGEANPPQLLTRRVHRAVEFAQYFGYPPLP